MAKPEPEPELELRPLQFCKTTHHELSPPIFDGDGTHGADYCVGELVSLACDEKNKALVLVVRFSAGPDAEKCGWSDRFARDRRYRRKNAGTDAEERGWSDEVIEVEYLVLERKRWSA